MWVVIFNCKLTDWVPVILSGIQDFFFVISSLFSCIHFSWLFSTLKVLIHSPWTIICNLKLEREGKYFEIFLFGKTPTTVLKHSWFLIFHYDILLRIFYWSCMPLASIVRWFARGVERPYCDMMHCLPDPCGQLARLSKSLQITVPSSILAISRCDCLVLYPWSYSLLARNQGMWYLLQNVEPYGSQEA